MRVHGLDVRHDAVTLLRRGVPNRVVAERLGVPRGTVGWWRSEDRRKRAEPYEAMIDCPICTDKEIDGAAYAYLLGLYLGDGHIADSPAMRMPSLSVWCTDTWPGLIEECATAMRTLWPDRRVTRVQRTGCQEVKIYSAHLVCLFPQCGPGRKHERRITLERWQRGILDVHPWGLVRGLVHSDGCRVVNRTSKLVAGERKRYEYPRYFFTNKSDDIRRLYTDTLDALGVAWTYTRADTVSVARKASVGLMDAHVGAKY